jgi:glycerate dehydrogenase
MKITVLDGHTLNPGDLNWEGIESMGELVVYDRTPADLIQERCSGASIIFTNKTPLDEAFFKQNPEVKYVGILATGYNIVDIEAARDHGVVVTNVPGYGTPSVAQMTFALILELCNRVQRHSDSVMDGRWSASDDFCYWDFPLVELNGKTIGIVGFGSIGRKVGDIAAAFGMNILASDQLQTDQSHRDHFKWSDIPQLLSASDIVTLHCPLTPETKGMINKKSLGLMKSTSFLINTSRGPLIVEQDLADALNQGKIAGAGLDVLGVEPPTPENPLLSARNCLITPHIAWASMEARKRLMDIVVNNLKEFLNGRIVNRVN